MVRPMLSRKLAIAPTAQEEAKHSVRILLVEDNPVNQKLAKMTLTKAGYLMVVADNGKEAAEIFTSTLHVMITCYVDSQAIFQEVPLLPLS